MKKYPNTESRGVEVVMILVQKNKSAPVFISYKVTSFLADSQVFKPLTIEVAIKRIQRCIDVGEPEIRDCFKGELSGPDIAFLDLYFPEEDCSPTHIEVDEYGTVNWRDIVADSKNPHRLMVERIGPHIKSYITEQLETDRDVALKEMLNLVTLYKAGLLPQKIAQTNVEIFGERVQFSTERLIPWGVHPDADFIEELLGKFCHEMGLYEGRVDEVISHVRFSLFPGGMSPNLHWTMLFAVSATWMAWFAHDDECDTQDHSKKVQHFQNLVTGMTEAWSNGTVNPDLKIGDDSRVKAAKFLYEHCFQYLGLTHSDKTFLERYLAATVDEIRFETNVTIALEELGNLEFLHSEDNKDRLGAEKLQLLIAYFEIHCGAKEKRKPLSDVLKVFQHRFIGKYGLSEEDWEKTAPILSAVIENLKELEISRRRHDQVRLNAAGIRHAQALTGLISGFPVGGAQTTGTTGEDVQTTTAAIHALQNDLNSARRELSKDAYARLIAISGESALEKLSQEEYQLALLAVIGKNDVALAYRDHYGEMIDGRKYTVADAIRDTEEKIRGLTSILHEDRKDLCAQYLRTSPDSVAAIMLGSLGWDAWHGAWSQELTSLYGLNKDSEFAPYNDVPDSMSGKKGLSDYRKKCRGEAFEWYGKERNKE